MRSLFRNNIFRFGMTLFLTGLYSLLRNTEWSSVVKPLPIIFWALVVMFSAKRPAAEWVVANLFAAALGDVLLDLGPDWLLIATLPFLGSTLLLALAFHLRGHALDVNLGRGEDLLLLLPIIALAVGFHLFMAPRLADAATVGAALLLISSLLLWRALSLVISRGNAVDPTPVRFIGFLGACGIVTNYILYSINIGLHPVPRDLVIHVYFWGQAFAAWSFLKPAWKVRR
ncbi:hypothetical protein GCM10011309_06890 [Litorimonas cladophorae]|uniref:Uncharacterized protein n=1 Tax=Litorimonas cladophorae TaxID=1220491 RepID=A0A918NB96_9PROT|nr:lysoplasmalogenase family protein [Litorimonas cladophorae]GGX59723.1 hypothetical protein GCM10011309_06890 [Litorimonas cladophorae]